MNNEYQKGKEIGTLVGEIAAIKEMLAAHIEKQDEWNEKMDKRVSIAEQWIQTTTGKVVVLTGPCLTSNE